MNTTAIFVAAALGLAAGPSALAQEALAKSSGCLGCHNVEGAKKMGPSFKDVAAKHKGEADAEAVLCAKVLAGKAHPTVKVSESDVKSLVKWVLTL